MRRTLFSMLPSLLVLLTACASRPPLPPRAVQLNEQGAAALSRGDLTRAAASLRLALAINERFLEATVNLALVELQRGAFGRAEQLLRRAERLNPDQPLPHHGLGLLAARRGQRDRAADAYRSALAIDPTFTPARRNLARLLFASGFVREARRHYEQLLALDDTVPEHHAGAIECYLRLHRLDDADAVLARAPAATRGHPWLRLVAGRLALRRGAVGLASEHFEVAAQDARHRVDGLAWLAVAAVGAGDGVRGTHLAREALARQPHHEVAKAALRSARRLLHSAP